MKRILLLFSLILVSIPCQGEDFSRLYRGIEIAWDVKPEDIYNNLSQDINVFWFGKGLDYEINVDRKGRVNVFWLFAHYTFSIRGPAAVREPFIVVDESTGKFLFHLIISEISIKDAAQFINNHKEPYFILIAGKPSGFREYKGVPIIVIESDRWLVRDYFKVNFIKANQKEIN